ncbi:hypothetical protein EVA_17257 [gut metagenome]|uniref:Uncharacterized protein n=1 Tax=gut metagenome TaxID=749906 RepID=J9FIC7_9ZZZZ
MEPLHLAVDRKLISQALKQPRKRSNNLESLSNLESLESLEKAETNIQPEISKKTKSYGKSKTITTTPSLAPPPRQRTSRGAPVAMYLPRVRHPPPFRQSRDRPL